MCLDEVQVSPHLLLDVIDAAASLEVLGFQEALSLYLKGDNSMECTSDAHQPHLRALIYSFETPGKLSLFQFPLRTSPTHETSLYIQSPILASQ